MHRSECIDHKRVGDKDGYASTQMHPFKGSIEKVKLHRLIYCLYNNVYIGNIDGKVIIHTCDNPRCINPFHLALGTTKDNVNDRVSKGRYCGSESIRAKLSDEDVKFIRTHYKKRCKVWNTYTLAAKFGVTNGTIGAVVRNESYKELDDASF